MNAEKLHSPEKTETIAPSTVGKLGEVASRLNYKERAAEEISYHADQMLDIQRDFAVQLKKTPRFEAEEFEKWEDDYAHESDLLEKEVRSAGLNIQDLAKRKNRLRAYFTEEELYQTIEAQAGNFYIRRRNALREAIAASDDPHKAEDAEVLNTFPQTVFEHLSYKYPTSAIAAMDPNVMEASRTRVHNDTIRHLNSLNDLARKYGTRPFTARNFWPSDLVAKTAQTPAVASLFRYDRDLVEEYYYQAFRDDEDKIRAEQARDRRFGL